jgi:hypothetical protein
LAIQSGCKTLADQLGRKTAGECLRYNPANVGCEQPACKDVAPKALADWDALSDLRHMASGLHSLLK